MDENMFALIHSLGRDGMWIGAILVTIYALVVPVVKAVLLVVLAVTWRTTNPATACWRNRCVALVQTVSKWASPDMFAYIILSCLLRGLDQPPKVEAAMEMGLGFTCFCVFCVGSTISSLGIRRPHVAMNDEDSETEMLGVLAQASLVLKTKLVRFEENLSQTARAWALAVLCSMFVCLLVFGLISPSMSMRVDLDLLYEMNPVFARLKPLIANLNLPELFDKQVSIWQCLGQLFYWAMRWEVNEGVAFVMLGVFAVLMPFAAMVALMVVGLCDFLGDAYAVVGSRARKCARILGHLAMLDVSVMGSVVVAMSLTNLREKGCIVELGVGVPLLLSAELCRYVVFHLVMHPSKAAVHRDGPYEQQATVDDTKLKSSNDLERGSENVAMETSPEKPAAEEDKDNGTSPRQTVPSAGTETILTL